MRIAIQIVRLTVDGITHEGTHKRVSREWAVVAPDLNLNANHTTTDYARAFVGTHKVADLQETFASAEWFWETLGDRGDCVELPGSAIELEAQTGSSITANEIRDLLVGPADENPEWLRETVYRALGVAWSGHHDVVLSKYKVQISEARDVCAALWNHRHGFKVAGLWTVAFYAAAGLDESVAGPYKFDAALPELADIAGFEGVHNVRLRPNPCTEVRP